MIVTVKDAEVQALLRGAELPDAVRACEFFVSDVPTDDLPTIVVVMIVTYGEWDEAAEQACLDASAAAWEALGGIDAYVDVVCRTKAEHDASRCDGPWVTLDDGY